MKILIISLSLFTWILFTACKNNSTDKTPAPETPEVKTENTPATTPTTAPAAPTATNGPATTATTVSEGPEKIVQKIFDAAKSGDFSKLKDLCDPTGYGDGDTKDICAMASKPKKDQDEFVQYFKNGSIVGEAIIEGDNATVNIKFGPDGTKSEKIILKKIMGNWYLSDF